MHRPLLLPAVALATLFAAPPAQAGGGTKTTKQTRTPHPQASMRGLTLRRTTLMIRNGRIEQHNNGNRNPLPANAKGLFGRLRANVSTRALPASGNAFSPRSKFQRFGMELHADGNLDVVDDFTFRDGTDVASAVNHALARSPLVSFREMQKFKFASNQTGITDIVVDADGLTVEVGNNPNGFHINVTRRVKPGERFDTSSRFMRVWTIDNPSQGARQPSGDAPQGGIEGREL